MLKEEQKVQAELGEEKTLTTPHLSRSLTQEKDDKTSLRRQLQDNQEEDDPACDGTLLVNEFTVFRKAKHSEESNHFLEDDFLSFCGNYAHESPLPLLSFLSSLSPLLPLVSFCISLYISLY